MRRIIATVSAVAVAALVAACGSDSGPSEVDRAIASASAQAEAKQKAKAAEEKDAAKSEQETLDAVQKNLLESYGADSMDEFAKGVEGSDWSGFYDGMRLQGSTLYVTLKVHPDSPDRDELGQEAVNGVAIAAADVDEVRWVVSEDSSGTIITQKQTSEVGS